MSDDHVMRRNAGSIMLVCMVFLAVLSMAALTAIEVSLIGQKMMFAYARHNNAFIDAESQLLEAEQFVWQQLESAGLASTALYWSDQSSQESPGHASVAFSVQWAQNEFSAAQCGALFSVTTRDSLHASSSALQLGTDWWVCCESPLDCEQARFLTTRRDWRRQRVQHQ